MRVEFLTSVKPPQAAWIFAVACWLLATCIVVATSYLRHERLRSHRLAQQSAAALQVNAPPMFASPPYTVDANEALRLNSNALDEALREVEAVSVVGAQLRSFDVDIEAGRAQVLVDFKDVVNLKTYLEQVNAGRDRDRWLLKQLDQRRDAASATPSMTALLERTL